MELVQQPEGLTVGHIPQEISRYTHYFIMHGVSIKGYVTSTQPRRSPIEQGGLEIQLRVTASIEKAKSAILTRYKQFIGQYTKYQVAPDNSEDSSSDDESSASTIAVVPKRRKVIVVSSDSDD